MTQRLLRPGFIELNEVVIRYGIRLLKAGECRPITGNGQAPHYVVRHGSGVIVLGFDVRQDVRVELDTSLPENCIVFIGRDGEVRFTPKA